MSKYLLEIGTEELPYKFIPQAMEQLKSGFKKFFQLNKIKFESIEVLATPRRLAVIVSGLAEKQPDEERVVKGPIRKVAYDENGDLTLAGKGFLRKNKVDEKDAYIENDYLYANIFAKGKLTAQAIQENVTQIVLKLQGPYFMRWAGFDEKFSRPIRWIVSILDDKEVPIKIINVKSSKFSRGHRFSNGSQINTENNVEICSPDEYVEKLKKAHVYVNQNERKSLIVDLTKKMANELGAIAQYDDDLLDEVTYLCEYPVPVVCDFDAKYLDIPEQVTVTVMANHQRYFALYQNNKLINKFITITNYIGSDFSNIKAGNERVITARLDDGIFFFNEDTKKKLEAYVDDLKGITFQKSLGSVYDKTKRIIKLSANIAKELGENSLTIERTALLCKADLTTSLVFEFTELQGYIGAVYAEKSGENDKVALGIKEHYYPMNAESELAVSIEGQIVGIADKLDTICAVFANGKKPTGSSDPLGVRRAALGILKTITNKGLDLNLDYLIKQSIELLPKQLDNKDKVIEQIEIFFTQRLIILLSECYRRDVLEACSSNKNPLINLCDFVRRVQFLSNLVKEPDFISVLESANRISKILKENINTLISSNLFVVEAEKNLFDNINKIDESTYETLFNGLKRVNPFIEKFFEDVLVMDENERIKENRLAMLMKLKKKYEIIATFSSLQI